MGGFVSLVGWWGSGAGSGAEEGGFSVSGTVGEVGVVSAIEGSVDVGSSDDCSAVGCTESGCSDSEAG